MAVVKFTPVEVGANVMLGYWGPLAAGDEPVARVVAGQSVTVQKTGTGLCDIQGTLAPSGQGEYATLTDAQGNALTGSWGPIEAVRESVYLIRPMPSAGAVDLVVWLMVTGR